MSGIAKTNPLLRRILYIVLAAGGVYLSCTVLIPWFMPFLLAFGVSALLDRPIMVLSKKMGISRTILSSMLVVLTYGALGGLLYIGGSWLITELIGLMEQLPRYITAFYDALRQLVSALSAYLPDSLRETLLSLWDSFLGSIRITQEQAVPILETLRSAAVSLPSIFMFVVTLIVSTLLISADYRRVTAFLMLQCPKKWRDRLYRTKAHLMGTLIKWLKALGILMLITFVELTVGFFLLDIDYAVPLAAIVSIVDMLPVLGVGTVLMPWALFELLFGSQFRAVGLAILYGVTSLVRNLCEPKIVGAQLGLHPLTTLICVYIGYKTLGLWGMVLFPILAITILKFQEWGYIRLFTTPKKDRMKDT